VDSRFNFFGSEIQIKKNIKANLQVSQLPYISGIRRTKSVIWNNLISKYLNSNFGKSLEKLLDISLNARTGKFIPHLFTPLSLIIDLVSCPK
jgi:hypothetical protein